MDQLKFSDLWLPCHCQSPHMMGGNIFLVLKGRFVKEFLLSTNPSSYTSITLLINKLVNATPKDAPYTTLINNWIDINTCK